jgi:hypothetical protein
MKGLADTDSLSSKHRGRIFRRVRIIRVDILRIIIPWGGSPILRPWTRGIIGWRSRIRVINRLRGRCLGLNRIRIKKSLKCFVGIIKG